MVLQYTMYTNIYINAHVHTCILLLPLNHAAAPLRRYGDINSNEPAIKAMAQRNTEQPLQNINKFGALQWDDPALVVIVVMAHNRPSNLEALFDSLRKVRGISKALVVVSQDFASEALDAAIAKVDFCLLLRIFLPASTQLHPHEFPGGLRIL